MVVAKGGQMEILKYLGNFSSSILILRNFVTLLDYELRFCSLHILLKIYQSSHLHRTLFKKDIASVVYYTFKCCSEDDFHVTASLVEIRSEFFNFLSTDAMEMLEQTSFRDG